jgi:nucleoside-diphosphate-sugar epimerase
MTISILGCGWVGLPLGQQLLTEGHTVKGSTTSDEKIKTLEQAGIEAYQIEFNPTMQCSDCTEFWDTDLLIIDIPPDRKRDDVDEYFPNIIQSVIEQIEEHRIGKVIFISSTSVYPNEGKIVQEKDAGPASRDSGRALLRSEHMLFEQNFETTVLRLAGLYGYDRHPVYYLSGRQNLSRGKAPVNLIHRDDVIEITSRIIKDDVMGEVFNVCSDGHPPRKALYTAAAEHFNVDPPSFAEENGEDTNYKIVSNEKVKKYLGYTFYYPNPMDHTP